MPELYYLYIQGMYWKKYVSSTGLPRSKIYFYEIEYPSKNKRLVFLVKNKKN